MPVRATAPDENARKNAIAVTPGEQQPVVGELVEFLRVRGQRLDAPGEVADEADAHQGDDHDHVQVGRAGEQAARLLQPAQVGEHHQRDETETQQHALGPQLGERGRDRGDAGRDRHRNREDVVDEQRRTGDERRGFAEVLARHDVGTAPARIGEDRLAVARDDDRQQDDDDGRDGQQIGQCGEAGERDEHQEDFLRRVRRRGDRVGGEHRQRRRSTEALMLFLGRRQGFTDDEPLE
jgi:hypothetical protein